ncbi:hypothetical protein VaNZ11_009334 [Volvox africanus]|uniref:RING-CH-type domain-containing protein n=1 Tax=Volvox africanus TaxID=51714 RepID=A0ABQ5S734_9CHLO|nr:hypothetical protein VaNZ11_009334 [Volvox africanus]
MATATNGPPFPGPASVDVNGQAATTSSAPLFSARGHGTQYGNGGGCSPVLATPPAITPLSSSLSQGFRQGLPSWLQEHTPRPPQPQPPQLQYPQTQARLQPMTQTQMEPHLQLQHPQLHRRSPFLPTPQAPRSSTNTALIDAADAAQQPDPARSLYSGGVGGMAQAMAPFPAMSRSLSTAATVGHGHNLASSGLAGAGSGMGHGPGPAPGSRIAPFRQDSPDDLPVLGDLPRGPAPVRGRSGIPRVASISEIEPVLESEEPSRPRASNSLLTRAISIPNAQERDRGLRTYRVAPAKSQGSQDDVTVVLEGAEASSGGARGGRGAAGGSSMHGSHQSYGSSGGGMGGSSVLAAASTSLRGTSFLGGLFGSRTGGTGSGMSGRGAGGLVSPERSFQGMDMLPFAGRERYYQATNELPTTTFGSLPASSLLRSRANASAGSILSRATGGLNTTNTKALKRSVSYQQFGAGSGGMGGGSDGDGAAADMPSSSAGAGRHGQRPARGSVNGGSDSSGACTSMSASQGGGLAFWLRGGGGGGGGGVAVARGGAGGSRDGGGRGSDSDGTVFGPVPAARRAAEPDLADLAVLATSLPASLGTWSLPRSVALASSPTTVGSSSVRGGSAFYGGSSSVRGGNVFYGGSSSVRGGRAFYGGHGNLSRADSVSSGLNNAGGSTAAAVFGGAPVVSGLGGGFPICLICLEVLTPEEFESGDAISLQCACKGEMSLRHRKCAIEWSHHKGDVICDICKQGIANLPPIPPEVLAAREAARRRRQPAFNTAAEPNFADFCFDCIRATWVTTIVCVLFFDVNVGQAFMFGSLVGLAFMLVSMVIAACARRARTLAAARAVERAAAESRAQEQQQLLQQQQQQQQQQHRWQQQQQLRTSGLGGGTGTGGSPGVTGPSGGSDSRGGGSLRGLSAAEPSLTVPLLAAADEV